MTSEERANILRWRHARHQQKYAPAKVDAHMGSVKRNQETPRLPDGPFVMPRLKSQDPSKEVIICTPQGVGDIFWVYQKFAPYFEDINIIILGSEENSVQIRSRDWLGLLPQVKSVQFRVVPGDYYEGLMQRSFPMQASLEEARTGTEIDYQCNIPLENGVRLEDIDPGFNIKWDVPLKVDTEFQAEFPAGEYLVAYVSGSTRNRDAMIRDSLWTTQAWFEFILGFREKYRMDLPVIVIGASYDRAVTVELEARLRAKVPVKSYIDLYPSQVLNILKGSVAYFGYQSGIGILADNMNVPQLMMYFPRLQNMLYTWCKKENIGSIFNADVFSRKPREVLDGLQMKV